MEDKDVSNQGDKELIEKLRAKIAALEQENQALRGNNNSPENIRNTNDQTREKSNSSKNESSSKILFPTYKKRAGTNDAGKEFEYMMCALYALKLCTKEEIVEFKITTNNEIYGDFDDISLEIQFEKETKMFLLQLKHKENEEQYVTNQKLSAAKGEFILTKYLKSFEELNVGDVTCLVYTNSPAKLQYGSNFEILSKKRENGGGKFEETKMNVTVKKPQALEFLNLIRNKRDSKGNDDIFQFDIIEEGTTFLKLKSFCENFFLMTGQDNLEIVKATIKKMLISLLKVDIYDSFIFFMREWWSGRFVLTKRDVISKLVELAMSPWIQTVSSNNINGKTRLLSKGIMNFDMTIVKNGQNNIINNIWNDTIGKNELRKTVQKFHIQKNQSQESKILWFFDKVPLIVKIDQRNVEQVKHSIKLLECLPKKKKLILVGNAQRGEFPKWKVLENLRDLHSLEYIYEKMVCRFRISLQGRRSINLEELIIDSQDFVDVIEIHDLLKMTQTKWLKVGNSENSLPESYIPRKVSAVCVKTADLLDDLQYVKNNVLIINCCAEFKNTLNTRHALVMELDEFLEKEKPGQFQNLILLSTDKPCTYSKFESVCKRHVDLQIYLFQVNDDCCIHLMNVGYKKLLRRSTKLQIEETEILKSFSNQLNVVFAPPGMGKSTLFNVLSKNCPTNLWVVYVKLIECNSFLAKQLDGEQLLRHFLRVDERSESLYTKILRVYLHNKKILILLDGVDELESQNANLLLDRAKLLSSEGFHVWISSRENWQEKISQDLRLFTTVNVIELGENEQKLYIEKRLKNKYDSSDIKEIVDGIFESSDIGNSRQMLGIPLQLYIITENFLTNESLFRILREENIFVLTTMYRFFFEGKRKFHLKKMGMEARPELIGFSFEHHLKRYELPALRNCLDDQTFEKLQLDECDSQEFLKDTKTSGDKFGIIKYVTAENKAVFFHQTYAEYFACVWFARNLDKVKLLREEWFSEKYENLRIIFDIMLSEQSPLHLAVIYNNIEQFRKYSDDSQEDKAGRNALYLACCYGMKYPLPGVENGSLDYWKCHLNRESEIYVEIVHSLLERCYNILQLDKLFGINYIHYALSSRCLYVIEACLERKLLSFRAIDKLLQKYYQFETIAFYASQMNYVHLLQNVLRKIDCNIIFGNFFTNSTDYHTSILERTLLCVAIVGSKDDHRVVPRKENVESVKKILKVMNKQKILPLRRQLDNGHLLRLACKLGCCEIIKILSAYQTICDGNNMLHMTACYGTQSDEVLNWLLKIFGLDVNEKNQVGETALYMACEKGNEKLVKQLLEFDAKIDVQNGFRKDNVFHVITRAEIENLAVMQMLLNKMNSEEKSLLNNPDKDGHYPLCIASREGHINYVKLLLRNGANINVSGSSGNTVLHYAACAWKHNVEILNIVLSYGININSKNTKGEIALHRACETGVFTNVKLLINQGSDMNARSDDGNTCLHYAVQCGHDNTETIKFLIHNTSQVNSQNNKGDTPLNAACRRQFHDEHYDSGRILLENGADASIVNKDEESPLHILLRCSPYYFRFDRLTLLLSTRLSNNGLNINGVDKNGNTALHLALGRKAKIIETLLENGADPNIPDKFGNNALHLLPMGKDFSRNLNSLISHSVNIDAQNNNGRTPLQTLLCYKHNSGDNSLKVEMVKALLKAGADVNIFDNQKNTALHDEAEDISEKVSFLKLLIKYDAKLNLQNSKGETPLHLAVKHMNWNKVETLVASGADINVMDDEGMTVLHYAAGSGGPKIIKLLVDKEVNLNARNKNGNTALCLAFKAANYRQVKTFVELGADVNVADNNKENILHYTMRLPSVREDIPKILIKGGVNINAQNLHGESPLHLACRNQNWSFVRFLLENGANERLLTLERKNILHYAAESLCFYNIHELLQKGFDKNAQDVNGTSILHYACKSGRLENIQILISNGANIHVTDNKQQTILHYAVLSATPKEDIMNYLVKTNADIYAKDSNGKNALDVAFEHERFRAIQLLIQTNKFFDPTKVSWSTLLYYSAFSGCCHGINYLIQNSDNFRGIECNKHVSLEFLKSGGDVQKDLLLKMTKYVANLIKVYGTDPTYGYKPTRLLEYINFEISRGPINSSVFENLEKYGQFREIQWEEEKPGF